MSDPHEPEDPQAPPAHWSDWSDARQALLRRGEDPAAVDEYRCLTLFQAAIGRRRHGLPADGDWWRELEILMDLRAQRGDFDPLPLYGGRPGHAE